MMYFLTKSKTNFIHRSFLDNSINDSASSFTQFQQLHSAAELHYLADLYNWDNDLSVLEWIVNSPLCDYGTALLIFWRAQPAYYTQFEDERKADYEHDAFRLLKTIIRNWESGKYRNKRIGYSPAAEGNDVDSPQPNAKWQIPAAFKQGNQGQAVIAFEAVQQWVSSLLHWLRNWRRQLRRRQNKRHR